MNTKAITIVGVGLIGGSLGLAIKKKNLAQRVIGVDVDNANLRYAESIRAIDEGFDDVAKGVARSQLVIVAAPMYCLAEQIIAAAKAANPHTVIMDTGSCKATVVGEVEKFQPKEVSFVGSHPLAGSEKSGPESADAELFDKRVAVITPTNETKPQALELVRSFWRNLGSSTVEMSPEEHDQILARTSHAPHVTAAVLAGLLDGADVPLAATGFRDTTRIAGGNPQLWTSIVQQNATAIRNALDAIQGRLAEFQSAIANGDWKTVEDLLTHAKKVRDALGN